MSVESIVDYVMNSPQNTNRMVLKGLIESEVEKHGAESGNTENNAICVSYTKGGNYEDFFGEGFIISSLQPKPEDFFLGIAGVLVGSTWYTTIVGGDDTLEFVEDEESGEIILFLIKIGGMTVASVVTEAAVSAGIASKPCIVATPTTPDGTEIEQMRLYWEPK